MSHILVSCGGKGVIYLRTDVREIVFEPFPVLFLFHGFKDRLSENDSL